MSRNRRLRLVKGGKGHLSDGSDHLPDQPPPRTLEELLLPYTLPEARERLLGIGREEWESVLSLVERARAWDEENRRRRLAAVVPPLDDEAPGERRGPPGGPRLRSG